MNRVNRMLFAAALLGLPLATPPTAATHECAHADPLQVVDVRTGTLATGEAAFYAQSAQTGIPGMETGLASVTVTSGRVTLYLWDAGCATLLCAHASRCAFDPTVAHVVEVFCYPGPCPYNLTIVS